MTPRGVRLDLRVTCRRATCALSLGRASAADGRRGGACAESRGGRACPGGHRRQARWRDRVATREGARPGSVGAVGPRSDSDEGSDPAASRGGAGAPQGASWGLGGACHVRTAQRSCPGSGPLADSESDVRVAPPARLGVPGRAPFVV
jgi:hypothetical protein